MTTALGCLEPELKGQNSLLASAWQSERWLCDQQSKQDGMISMIFNVMRLMSFRSASCMLSEKNAAGVEQGS